LTGTGRDAPLRQADRRCILDELDGAREAPPFATLGRQGHLAGVG
jgi:hypothetical protein